MSVFFIIGAGLEAERERGTNKWGLATKPQRPGQNPFHCALPERQRPLEEKSRGGG